MQKQLPVEIIKGRATGFSSVRCDCGTEEKVVSYRLTDGRKISCAWCPIDHLSSSEKSLHRWLSGYKANAKQKKLEWAIDDDHFYLLVKQACYYCGATERGLNGLDRRVNEIGYTISNVVTCCQECNFMKGSRLSEYLFLRQAIRIAEWQKLQSTYENFKAPAN